jgi:hypothetical protein
MKRSEAIDKKTLSEHSAGSQTDPAAQFCAGIETAQN